MENKKASLMYEFIIHLIIIAFIFALFFLSSVNNANSRGVKQQVLEKQLALMIDSSMQGMSFSVNQMNSKGVISNLEIKKGRVFVYVDGITYSSGYPYFTKYNVQVEKTSDKFGDKFIIKIT